MNYSIQEVTAYQFSNKVNKELCLNLNDEMIHFFFQKRIWAISGVKYTSSFWLDRDLDSLSLNVTYSFRVLFEVFLITA